MKIQSKITQSLQSFTFSNLPVSQMVCRDYSTEGIIGQRVLFLKDIAYTP